MTEIKWGKIQNTPLVFEWQAGCWQKVGWGIMGGLVLPAKRLSDNKSK